MLIQSFRRVLKPLADERGVALPMAMVMLVILASMMVAFSVLAKSEPEIAANQMHTAQSLRLADSGLELAIWALNNKSDASGIDYPAMAYGGTAGGNYDGNHFFTLGTTGGFTVLVQWVNPTNSTWERTVTAVGWTPSKDAGAMNSHRKIQAVVQYGVVPPLDPPCVVCVAGEVQVNGSAATFNSSSGGCPGAASPPQYAIQSQQALQYNAHPTFTGFGTSDTAAINQTGDTSQFKFSTDSLAKLKAYAQSRGTYYTGARTSLPTTGCPCLVYIDTADGSDFSNSTPTANDGSLSISGSGTFTGAVIVAGTANISGSYTINGLIYSLNDLSLSGTVTVNGATISENRRDSSSTNVDTDYSGNITMNYNCTNIRNGTTNLLGASWVVKNGAYQETSGY
ncbi:MAG TPA: hypothetical protein VGM22_26900 [Methylomirabilota bacterium]